MTFSDYVEKLYVDGVSGIKTIIKNDHDMATLDDDRYEKIMDMLRKSVSVAYMPSREILPGLTTSMLRAQIVYDLYRLDKSGFRIDAYTFPNTSLTSRSIMSYLTRADIRMRNFPSIDARSYFTAITVSISILYCMEVGKTVEAKLLSKLTVKDMRVQELNDTFERAQSIMNDVRKYNNRAAFYDPRLLYFMNGTTAATPSRPAF